MDRFMRSLVLFLLILAASCQQSPSKVDPRVLRINIAIEPESLDPHKARDLSDLMVVRMLFEGLTRMGQDNQATLALAESVRLSEDQKEYVFLLKPSLWSDGSKVTAEDFVYAYQRILSPAFPSSTAFQLYVIKGAKEAKEGKLPLSDIGVEALDETHLKIVLNYPTPYFLELLTLPCFFPISKAIDQKMPNWMNHQKTYVGNGPFSLKTWKHEDHLFLSKNLLYWDKEHVHLEGLSCLMVKQDTEVALFEKNELDFAGSPFSTLPVDALSFFRKTGLLQSQEAFGTSFLRINQEKEHLQNGFIRRALSFGLNREDLAKHVLQGGQLPAYSLLPPALGLNKEGNLDSRKAVSFLQKGLESLKMTAVPKIRLLYRAGERNHLVVQTLKEQWRSSLGIEVDLEPVEGNVYYDRIAHLNYDLALGSWFADISDPINFLEVFKLKNAGSNNTGWEHPEYDQLLTAAEREPEKRTRLLTKAEKILLEEGPIIPLYHANFLYLVREGIHNVVVSPLGGIDFKWVEKEEK